MWSYTWCYNIDELAKYFRVICFDTKGYGYSDKPVRRDKDDPGYKITELKSILETLCDEPAIVVTQSLWGTVGLAVAEEAPDLIAALVVIGAPLFLKELPTKGLKFMSHLPMGLVRRVDRLRLLKYLAPCFRFLMRTERSKMVVRDRIPDEDIYWQSYPYIAFPNTLIRLIIDVKQARQDIIELQQNQGILYKIIEKLPLITCPTLVLWGKKDALFSTSDCRQLQDAIPNARSKVIPNCGHDSCSDCCEEINYEILAFSQELEMLGPEVELETPHLPGCNG
jgi:pimeloyl-ACP methyl ester carboxylesterase